MKKVIGMSIHVAHLMATANITHMAMRTVTRSSRVIVAMAEAAVVNTNPISEDLAHVMDVMAIKIVENDTIVMVVTRTVIATIA